MAVPYHLNVVASRTRVECIVAEVTEHVVFDRAADGRWRRYDPLTLRNLVRNLRLVSSKGVAQASTHVGLSPAIVGMDDHAVDGGERLITPCIGRHVWESAWQE